MLTFDFNRAAWKARAPRVLRKAPVSYTHLEVHHTVKPTIADWWEGMSPEQIMQLIQRAHLAKRWNDIFYNGFVMPDGNVWEGRPDTPDGSFRLCFLGNFMTEEPTVEQLNTLAEWNKKFPGETTWHAKRAAGTKYASACPGTNMIEVLKDIDSLYEQGDTMNIPRLYTGILGREGDAAGIAFWVEQQESGAWQPLDILVEFLSVRFAADNAASKALGTRLDGLTRPDIKTADVERMARAVFYAELRELAESE